MSPDDHDASVQRSFERQVHLFEGDDAVFARRAADVAWAGDVEPDWIALDVACGAAHNAQALASHVRQAVGIDITRAVLESGRERLASEGVTNVLLQEGDAAAMPFLDDSFDLVVCRASLHHFEDPARQVREMARVCRPNGRLVLTDMVAAPPDTRARFDEVHRWIDPSHDRVLVPDELDDMVARCVGPVVRSDVGAPIVLSLDAFMTDQSDRERVVAALEAEIDGGAPTGFAPSVGETGIDVRITSMVVHASPVA